MIKQMTHVSVPVLDQESAKDFYTEKLGFEVRADVEADGFRWLTVGPKDQPDLEFVLSHVAPPMFDPETAEQIRAIVAKGVLGIGVLRTDDCRATYEELSAKGVTFMQEPAERPYGTEVTLRDDSGNWFSVVERPDAEESR